MSCSSVESIFRPSCGNRKVSSYLLIPLMIMLVGSLLFSGSIQLSYAAASSVTASATVEATAFGNERRIIQDNDGNLVAVTSDSTTLRILYNNDPPSGAWSEATTITSPAQRSGGGVSIAHDSTNDAIMLAYEDNSGTTQVVVRALTLTKSAGDITGITVGTALSFALDKHARNPSLWRLHNGEFGLAVGDDSTGGAKHADVHGCRIVFASPLTNAPTRKNYLDGTNSCPTLFSGSAVSAHTVMRPTLAQRTNSGTNQHDIIVVYDYDNNNGAPFKIKIDWGGGPTNWGSVTAETALTTFGSALNTPPTMNYDSTNGRIVIAEFDDTAQTSFDVAYIADSADTTETGIDPTGLTSVVRVNPSIVINADNYWIFYDRDSNPTDLYYIKDTAGTWGSETLFRDATTQSGAKRVNCKIDGSSFRVDCIWTEEAVSAGNYDVWHDSLSLATTQSVAETVGITDGRNSNPTKVLSETLSLSDGISFIVGFVKTLNETLTLTDTNVRAFSRKLDESLSLSDTVTTSSTVTKNLSESLSLSDAVKTIQGKNLSESLSLSDTVTTTVNITKNLSESLSLSDTVSARISIKNLQETLTVNDAVAGLPTKLLGETLSLSDTVSARISIKNLSESLSLSDTVSARISIKNLQETLSLSDTVTTTSSVTKNLSESLSLSDTRTTAQVKNLSESLSLSDALTTTGDVTKNLSETLALSDTRTATQGKNLAETLSLSDALTTTSSITRNLAETLSLSDTRTTTQGKNLAETLSLSDIVSARIAVKNLAETLSFSDALTTLNGFTKNLSETLSLSDTRTTTQGKNLAESLPLSDAITTTGDVTKNLSETLSLSDTVNARIAIKNLAESLSLSDIVTNSAGVVKNLAETLFLSDAVSARITIKNLAESLTMSDTVSTAGDVTKNLSETLSLSDTVNARIAIKNLQETLTLSDTVTTIGGVVKNLAETLSISDTVSARITTKNLSETLSLSDTVSARITIKNLSEALGLNDALSVISSNIVSLSETIGLGDTVTTVGIANNNRVEALGMTDSIGLAISTPTPSPSPTPVSVNSLGGPGMIGGINMTFPNISTAGTLTVTMLNVNDAPPLPPELTLLEWVGSTVFVDIDTTATFTGFIQIAVGYNDTGIEFEETGISLMHFNGINWEDITTSVDTDNNIVYGQTDSLSPFGMGVNPGKLGGRGGGGPAYEIIDTVPPEIVSQYYEPSTPFSGQELRVLAKINDDVQITKAYLLYFVNTPEPEFHQVSMVKHNAEYFMGTIPASDVRIVGMTYWIFAEDFGGNNAQSAVQNVEIKQSTQVVIPPKPSQKNLPSHVLEAIKPKIIEPVAKLELLSMNNGNEINTFADTIVIRNTGNKTADNIRIMLSPEISKSFKLSDLSIKSIEPNENVTIALEVNGNPNRDMLGGLVGYNGNVIVMAEHLSPITLSVNIGGEESTYEDEYMDKVAAMAEQRYSKISLLNSLLTKQDKIQPNYEVTTADGDGVITNPSDEIVIRNLSEKQLKNVRIYLNNAGNAFLLEHRNIQTLEPNGQVSIKLISKMDSEKYSPRDIKGELLIVPSNDNPIVIPIDIVGQERKDSADEFEIITLLGNDGIFTAHDKIIIKNLGNRTLDSVRLMLPVDLARVFMLNNDSFKQIAPNSEVTVDLKFREESGDHRMGLLQNYQGELTVVSEHHRAKVIPVNITWNEISSEHFLVYSRNSESDTAKAKELISFLESNYLNVTSRYGEIGKTAIYVTSTLEEFRMLSDSDYSDYSFIDDIIFICGCQEDVKSLALKELVYKITFNKYPNYSNKEKFMLDEQNWLMDGIANYVTSNMTDGVTVKSQVDAFKQSPTSFVWYGTGGIEQYGATYTFFEYLQEKYGSNVIDKSLYFLGSGMISNHRCDTLEECAVLRAVYDVSGMDMNERQHHVIDVETLVSEWEDYITEHYSFEVPKQDQTVIN